MGYRVLRGKRLDGSYGFDVSKPGYDVTTTDKIGLAFCSDLKIPRIVKRGSIAIAPIAGIGVKDASIPGGQQSIVTIPFGATYSRTPVCVAIAKAPDWTTPLVTNFPQLGYLQNNWHTQIIEQLLYTNPAQTFNHYGTNVSFKPAPDPDRVSSTWASARFYLTVTPSSLTIATNCRSVITVKYLALEYI